MENKEKLISNLQWMLNCSKSCLRENNKTTFVKTGFVNKIKKKDIILTIKK